MMRPLAGLALAASISWGQFSGLAASYDGSVVYFASTLRIKGSSQPTHGKLFVADESGVRLFRSRARADLPQSNNPARWEPFMRFLPPARFRAMAGRLRRESGPRG
jgi:hypothetical protein